ncbi:MAG: DNA replication and repair protein RecF [bacterium]
MITDIHLQNFRSYKDSSFEVSPGVNIVVGPNASGKTNLLESILVVCKGSSYRVSDQDLICFKKPWTRLDAHLSDNTLRTVKIIKDPSPSKTYEINEKTYKRLSLNLSLPVVLFEPNHLQLMTGSPERRRSYLDELLEQTSVGYGGLLRQYKRVLAQRNSLLKQSASFKDEVIFPWNIKLSHLAGQIVRERTRLIQEINKLLPSIYRELSKSKTSVKMEYLGTWPADVYETSLLKKLESSIEMDRIKGFTSSGPHREDFVIMLNNHPASETASRGETRTAVLALKIIELQIIESSREQTPILLLDDVFSELDGKRRHALTDYLDKYQTFITTTDADLVVKNFARKCNVIALIGN